MSARVLDIGSGAKRDPAASVGLDYYPYPGVDVVWDLSRFPWPFGDASFERAVCHQVIEHLPTASGVAGEDPFFRFFDEVWRVLEPGGTFDFDVPDRRAEMAYGDPTHRRFFAPAAFLFLWDAEKDRLYRRRLWERVSVDVERSYGGSAPWNTWHVRRYAPFIDRVLQRAGIGEPQTIRVVLRKPNGRREK